MYIDAFYDRDADHILIAERVNGARIVRRERPEHVFYYTDPRGLSRTIFDDPVKRYSTYDARKFHTELKKKRADPNTRIFESDINVVFRHLAKHYPDGATPALNVGLFDIEVDFDGARGFAPTDDPFSPVTAISLHDSTQGRLYTLALCPPTLSLPQAEAIAAGFSDTLIFQDESELLLTFLGLIEDIDVLSGWNSEGYDVPYLVNRVRRVLGPPATAFFCLWDQAPIDKRAIGKYGSVIKTYELVGRVHLDYMQLYRKHNTQEQHSYRLDFIGNIEVGETKTPYEGTLDELYKNDFTRFIEYNRQDVMLLAKIDQKRKFIDLANQIAHENCILLKTTMGTVAFVEQAIINEMHKMGYVVPDRAPRAGRDPGGSRRGDHKPVVGAYVAKPKVGLHAHVGCVDINSLYPSAIRALNMSPETIVGQVRPTRTLAEIARHIANKVSPAAAWEGMFAILEVEQMHARDTEHPITVEWLDGSTTVMTGAQLYDHVFDPAHHLCITANGTLFRTDRDGMIPRLLATWYADRRALQAKARQAEEAAKAAPDEASRAAQLRLAAFYDQRQYAGKIRLNALYGALLQPSCRFYDERIGQSTTLTGRSIVRHMNAKINQLITGSYDYCGAAIKYADTDSCYFSVADVWRDDPQFADFDWSRETIIAVYDQIAEQTNASFAGFMQARFNTDAQRGGLIKAGRELVASQGLFVKKKKYAVLIYDKEGLRTDIDQHGKPCPGKLKVMGLDLKRADTPKAMQVFLHDLLMKVLQDAERAEMYADIKRFRTEFVQQPGWAKGSPKRVNKLGQYTGHVEARRAIDILDGTPSGRLIMPGHVRASINWNALCEMHQDRYSMRIIDAMRIIVCKLTSNPMRIDSVAYPVDQPHLPAWFRALPFDHAAMEESIIDKKITNLVGVLNWDLSQTKERQGEEFFGIAAASPTSKASDADDDDHDEEEEDENDEYGDDHAWAGYFDDDDD